MKNYTAPYKAGEGLNSPIKEARPIGGLYGHQYKVGGTSFFSVEGADFYDMVYAIVTLDGISAAEGDKIIAAHAKAYGNDLRQIEESVKEVFIPFMQNEIRGKNPLIRVLAYQDFVIETESGHIQEHTVRVFWDMGDIPDISMNAPRKGVIIGVDDFLSINQRRQKELDAGGGGVGYKDYNF